MLEHLFRNLTDIRVFDVFYCEYCDGQEIDIDGIIEVLECSDREYIQIEDSVEHLTECKILEKVYVDLEGCNGCRTCSWLDKMRLPRIGEHKTHKPYEIFKSPFPYYRIAVNDLTNHLWQALFESSRLYGEEVQKEIEKEENK